MRAVLIAAALGLAAPAAAALETTPAQSEGPYYPVQKPAETDADLTRVGAGPPAKGTVLALRGKVVDPSGAAVPGARVEIWQTDAQGIYMHPGDPRSGDRDRGFQFYGAAVAGADGGFAFRTILPAPYGGRPRHIHAKITPPGGRTLTTQFYFKSDAELSRDGIVRRLGPALDRVTLDPAPAPGGNGALEAAVTIVLARN